MTLLSATLTLDPVPEHLPRWTGHILQSWFLAWIRSANPALSARLHDQPGRKPYTVSPLKRSDVVSFRLTTLNAELTDTVTTLLDAPLPEMTLGQSIHSLAVMQRRPSSYELLVREATEQPDNPGLRFITATGFHSGGLDVPLPMPSLVFGSLIHAWDSFSPLPLPVHLADFVRDHVALSSHQIRTEHVVIPGHGAHLGFTGRVQFGIVKAGSSVDTASMINLIGALLSYAEFAGVGVRTTVGMGQVTTFHNKK